MTNQPHWRLVYESDYSSLYEDTTGVYAPELEIFEDDESSGTSQMFRFSIDRCALEHADRDDPTSRTYLVPASIAGRTDLPNPIHHYEVWFAKDLASVADSVGSTAGDLIEALCCEDAPTRAVAYEAIGGYHGFLNFDQYPRELTLDRE